MLSKIAKTDTSSDTSSLYDSKDINTCIRRCGPEPLSLSLNIKGPSKYFTAISKHYILEDRAKTTTAINSITV